MSPISALANVALSEFGLPVMVRVCELLCEELGVEGLRRRGCRAVAGSYCARCLLMQRSPVILPSGFAA